MTEVFLNGIRRRLSGLSALLFSAALVLGTAVPAAPVLAAGSSRGIGSSGVLLRAVTYTGDEWAVNFWDSELNNLEQDFRRIRGDGFNAVVLVVPWRQFQPSETAGDMNPDAYQKLRTILAQAEKSDLKVVLRVGYTWDNFNRVRGASDRYRGIRTNPQVRKAWLSYVQNLYRTASAYESFAGGFLSWEDFWGFLKETEKADSRSAHLARNSGYVKWLLENRTEEEIRKYYGTEGKDGELFADEGAEQVTETPEEQDLETLVGSAFPDAESPARRFVYAWNDAWMNELLRDSQEVFPDLSLEVRLDIDPVRNLEGYLDGCAHTATFAAENASFTSCMYASAMGFRQGMLISADQGIEKAWEILGDLQENAGGKPVFIDQFLYVDNTPEFLTNARLAEGEVPAYITGMAPVIRSMGGGYAVWTYRDYADNVITNGQFGQGNSSWRLSMAEVVREDGNAKLHLRAGASASQDLNHQFTALNEEDIAEFRAEAVTPALLEISTGKGKKRVTVEEDGTVRIPMGVSDSSEFSVTCLEGEVKLDNIKLYSYITEGGIYGEDGEPGPYLEAVRELNRLLEE